MSHPCLHLSDIFLFHYRDVSSLFLRCRRGSAEILVNFDELSLADMKQEEVASEKGAVKNFQICGKDVPRGYWVGTQTIKFNQTIFGIMSCIL